MDHKIRVLIAEDHATVRGAVKILLDSMPDLEVVGEAADGEEAVELSQKLQPDVVLMDIAMPGVNGAQATRRLKSRSPNIKVLVLTRHDEDGYLQTLFAEGADGYVLKQSSPATLVDGVRQVAAGNGFIDPSLTESVMSGTLGGTPTFTPAENVGLNPREAHTLRLTALGFSNKEIAETVGVSIKTIETSKSTAMHKLGLSSRVDVVHYAIQCGWMENK